MATVTEATEPRGAPAGAAVAWMRDGWAGFRQEPGTWVAMWVTFVAIMIVVGLIPFVGLIGGALAPILTGGLMRAAQARHEGRPLRFDHLFDGFRYHLDQLAVLGLIYLAATVALAVAMLVGALSVGGILGVAGLSGALDDGGAGLGMAPAVLLATLGVVLVLVIAGFMIVGMAMWWAPALIAIDGLPAVVALRLSLVAVLRNWLPLTVHGLIAFALALAALFTLGLGFLVLGPVLGLSLHAAYRDVFHGQGR